MKGKEIEWSPDMWITRKRPEGIDKNMKEKKGLIETKDVGFFIGYSPHLEGRKGWK
jgi:hypothetical protein